jgi:predicted DNA-binding transcriptional regulator YafY
MSTSSRLLRLLSLLQTPRDWTGGELAARLEVSPRTVRNDIERLRDLGYPVLATRGAGGGYRLGAGAAMPPLLLDDEEAVAVAIGLRTAVGGAIAGMEETSLRALAKLEQVLPSRLRHRVAALQTYTVAVPPSRRGPTVDASELSSLAAACRDRERLRFDYRTHDGATARREVEPYRLVNWGRRWYLVAWDTGRADWRTFRVDRMELKVPTGPRFTARALPAADIAEYVARRVSAAGWSHRARITVFAPAADVIERIDPSVGAVEAVDEHTCVLSTGADSLTTIAVYVGMLGLDFRVDDPPELADRVREVGERYLRAVS